MVQGASTGAWGNDPLRFDDTLDTVLSADLATAFGRQSAYRQLVDLIGRDRVPADVCAISVLRTIAPDVPLEHRTAAARALAFAQPPFALVRLFALDDLAVAAPVLRTARLEPDEWCALLAELTPSARAILRHRRDLDGQVERALAAFGRVDFVLSDRRCEQSNPDPSDSSSEKVAVHNMRTIGRQVEREHSTIGSLAIALPVSPDAACDFDEDAAVVTDGPFEIADVVARIDAFREGRNNARPHANDASSTGADRVRFETDADGVIRYADGPARGALIGLSLCLENNCTTRVDSLAADAFRERARFRDANVNIAGNGPTAGMWLMSGVPMFDSASGRFTGYRGTVRRPHAGEAAAPGTSPEPVALRQLAHELRTPTNAIIGFSEMMALEMLGPVTDAYREQAQAIHRHARDLLGAIDDLDLAARIESDALTLRIEAVPLRTVLRSVLRDLSALASFRGATVSMPDRDAWVEGDRHAVERLFGRLIATLLAAMGRGEVLAMDLLDEGDMICVAMSRPAGLPDDADLSCDVGAEDVAYAALPLGTGFALRLVANLAQELGGAIAFGDEEIEVRLPVLRQEAARTATRL